MSAFQLVIFDCDGVLVDSERITNTVFCSMLNELGLAVSLEDMFERFVGLSMPQCIEAISEMLGAPPPEDFVPRLRRRAEAALKADITPIAGVAEALKGISIPYCVASSGDHEKIRLTLNATGLLKHFENRIFSVADVERPKPAPDVFLHAARTMGAEPMACAVVEDTPTGVRAGVSAGMRVFGFSANTPEYRLKEAGAHYVFSEMRHLPTLLRGAGQQSVPADAGVIPLRNGCRIIRPWEKRPDIFCSPLRRCPRPTAARSWKRYFAVRPSFLIPSRLTTNSSRQPIKCSKSLIVMRLRGENAASRRSVYG